MSGYRAPPVLTQEVCKLTSVLVGLDGNRIVCGLLRLGECCLPQNLIGPAQALRHVVHAPGFLCIYRLVHV